MYFAFWATLPPIPAYPAPKFAGSTVGVCHVRAAAAAAVPRRSYELTQALSPAWPGREIIFPTAVPDPQYKLICIQPIRDRACQYRTHLHTANQRPHLSISYFNFLYKFTRKNGDLRLPYTYCTVLSFRGPCNSSWTITLVRGKLTLL